jgi:hypothetical protein
MQNPVSSAALSLYPWSEVRANDRVMRYRRSGTGAAVLLVAPCDGGDALWADLPAYLSSRFRLIVPEIRSCPRPDESVVLQCFLEGLGTPRIAIVAANELCMPSLEVALRNPDQISHLVLVPGGESDGSTVDGTLMTSAPLESVPLLIVPRSVAGNEALPLIGRFLAGTMSS